MPALPRHIPEVDAYLKRLGEYALLSAEQERELGRRAQAGCETSRQALVTGNLRLVVMVACRFRNRGLDLPDLIAEGNLGLVHAAEKFDPAAGCRFSTYAVWWIQQPIRRALERTRAVRLPAHMAARTAAWRRIRAALELALGREPTPLEIAGELGLNQLKQRGVRAAVATADRRQVSIEAFRDDTNACLRETLPDHNAPPPWDSLDRAEAPDRVRSLLASLDERSRLILELRFGIGFERALTRVEVGAIVHLTRERVRQIEQRALQRLQAVA